MYKRLTCTWQDLSAKAIAVVRSPGINEKIRIRPNRHNSEACPSEWMWRCRIKPPYVEYVVQTRAMVGVMRFLKAVNRETKIRCNTGSLTEHWHCTKSIGMHKINIQCIIIYKGRIRIIKINVTNWYFTNENKEAVCSCTSSSFATINSSGDLLTVRHPSLFYQLSPLGFSSTPLN